MSINNFSPYDEKFISYDTKLNTNWEPTLLRRHLFMSQIKKNHIEVVTEL